MVVDSLSAGKDALASGDWDRARALFEEAAQQGGSPEAWEGLGWAAYWLADADLTFKAREQAFRGYRERGDAGAAARVAAWLAADHVEYRGDEAVGSGWFERAHRMLEGIPRGPDHGWLALLEASCEPDMEVKAAAAREASKLGRELGVPDLEAVGLAVEGSALVALGKVAEGMRLLDEASAIAAGEELQLPISLGWTFCCMVSSCDGVGDFPRAAQWSHVMRGFTERWGGRQLLGVCRSSYGRVLTAGGDWEAAEAELTAAVAALAEARPGMAAVGMVRLAELRARQGRAAEARQLFEQSAPHPMAIVGLGAMALAEGDPQGAADAAQRVLRNLPETSVLSRMPALELLVRARAAEGRPEAVEAECEQLQWSGAELGTPYLVGRARLAAAELAAARGDYEGARRAAEDAIDRFTEGSAPYDCGLARLELARTLAALGRRERSVEEAKAAKETFDKLGAARDGARAERLIAGGSGDRDGGEASLSELTPRELEVLRLVAQGMSDAEIAEHLVVSPHTVHRHVANVRVKLRLPSRAAAVAYAARAGLL